MFAQCFIDTFLFSLNKAVQGSYAKMGWKEFLGHLCRYLVLLQCLLVTWWAVHRFLQVTILECSGFDGKTTNV